MPFRLSIAVLALTSLAAVPVWANEKTKDKPKISPTAIPSFTLPDVSASNSAYSMTPEDLAFDCKKLTGIIRVRIRQMRSASGDSGSSQLARGLQYATRPVTVGTNRGIDPAGDSARDLAQISAYNKRLTEKNCPAFDLAKELAPGNTAPPAPIRAAKPVKPLIAPAAAPAPRP